MSLLMDALRKAEQAKKKAQQERESAESASVPAFEEKPGIQAAVSVLPTPEPLEESKYSLGSLEQQDADEDVADEIALELEPKSGSPSSMSVAPQASIIPDTAPQSDDSQRDHTSQALEPKSDEGLSLDAFADRGEESSEPAAESPDDRLLQIPSEEEVEIAVDQSDESTENDAAEKDDALAALMEVIPEAVRKRAEAELALSRGETNVPKEELESNSARAEPKQRLKGRGLAKSERSERDRKSAGSVFAAKRPMQKARRNVQLAGMGIAALLVFGFGIYFYIAIQTDTGMSITVPADIAFQDVSNAADSERFENSVETPEPTQPIVAISENSVQAEVAAPLDFQDQSDTSQTISQTIGSTSDAQTADTAEAQSEVSAGPDELVAEVPVTQPLVVSSDIPARDVVTAAPQVSSDNSNMPNVSAAPVIRARIDNPLAGAADIAPINLISFTRRQSTSTLDPALASAYAAYEEGELLEAERLYSQALVNSPHHKDALLGLASLAVSNGENARAMELYSRLLDRDPNDPVARAGLLELMPRGSSIEQERELKRLASLHPDVATLAYALGNFYASGQRWSDAQQMYFRALQLAKADASSNGQINPDYAFNLAISLEHLNQIRPAQDYYQQALEFASSHPASFDLGTARSRLESIRGSL